MLALAAAGAAAAVLLLPDARRRALAMLAAGLLAGLALAFVVDGDPLGAVADRPLLGVAAALGALAVAALAVLLRRRPEALLLLTLAAAPFRVPVPTGDETADVLLPLYAVIAAGCVAYAYGALRGARDDRAPEALGARPLRWALAAVVVLYAAQALYSTDTDQAVETIAFFHVPFAVLFVLLLASPWTAPVLRRAFGLVAGLAVLFAVVGVVQFATGELLISNARILEANELQSYFRVNSLFFDPNIYGRFLALVMIALACALLWTRRRAHVLLLGAALALLWAGLVFSLSQSSFAALLGGLAILAAARWRGRPVALAAVAAAVAAIVVVVAAPAAVGLQTGSERQLDRATSGRVKLVEGALRMVGDRPLYGFGAGSFAERYRVREGVRSERQAAISHTTPLTIAAEQGAIGLLGYLALLVAALVTLFGGVLAGARAGAGDVTGLGRLVVAAAFCGLLLHTYAYAAFLEDPLTWILLGTGAGLTVAARAVRVSAPADRSLR